jgi:acyl-CoA oxidase
VKLVGALAQSVSFNLAQNHIGDYYVDFIQELYGGSENYKPLKIIHHFTAGLKSYYTNSIQATLTTLREACGGAGFHAYSGLPYLCNEHSAYVAFEGDNTVMILQAAKLIIDGVQKNKVFKFEFFKYLNDLPKQFEVLPVANGGHKNLRTLVAVEEALRVRAAYSVYRSVIQGMAKDKGAFTARQLNNEVYQQDQVTLAVHHMTYYTVWSAARHLAKSGIKCPNLLAHLTSLVTLYCLTELARDSLPLFDCGYFVPGANAAIFDGIKTLTASLRPQYISLVEGFDIPDCTLNSAIGNKYGDIYETYINLAVNSRLNQRPVPKGMEHMLPILTGKL